MSTETRKKPTAWLYFLPVALTVPVAAAAALAVTRFWPSVHKLLSIVFKLVVKA